MALYGLDLSKYQSTDAVRQAQDFVILKATYGTGYVEPDCDNKYQLAKSLGKLLGVYHVAYNRLNSAVDEANWFVDNIQGYLGEAMLFLDYEKWITKAGFVQCDPKDVNWAMAFLEQVYARTKVRALPYMSASVIGQADWSPVAANYALWCAGYPASFEIPNPPTPRTDGADMPYSTGPWPYATIWQYSSSAGTLDRNIAYMTKDAWHKFALGDRNVQPTPVPLPTPNPTPVSAQPEPTPVTGSPVPSTGDETSAQPTPPANQPTIPNDGQPTTGAPSQLTSPAPRPARSRTLWELVLEFLKSIFKR